MNLGEARGAVRKRQRQSRTIHKDGFDLKGGLNLVDPPLVVDAGMVAASENYEPGVRGGYERIGGFERFDGQPSPSEENYYILPFRYGEVLPPEMRPGENFQDSTNANAGVILEIVYLTEPGLMFNGSADIWNGTAAAARLVQFSQTGAPTSPPKERVYDVQPMGIDVLPFGNSSGPTVPKGIGHWIEAATTQDHYGSVLFMSGSNFIGFTIGDIFRGSFFVQMATPGRRYIEFTLIKSGPVILDFTDGDPWAVIDIQEGTVFSTSGAFDDVQVENYLDGWWRVKFTTTDIAETVATGGGGWVQVSLLAATGNPPLTPYLGDGVSGVFFGGLNMEWDAPANLPSSIDWTPFRSHGNVPLSPGEPSGLGYLAYRARLVEPFNDAVQDTQSDIRTNFSVTVAESSGDEQQGNAPTRAKHQEYLYAAADGQRAKIFPVPGVGPMLGVWFYNGKVYAFRDDIIAVGHMYVSSASGWTEVVFDPHLDFKVGELEISEGDVLDGVTSGAQATVLRVNVINNDWGGAAAAGTLVLSAITGGPFFNNEHLHVSAVKVGQADLADYVPTFQGGGAYEFRNYNFFGATDKRRMFGVHGQGRLFEYDSTDDVLASYRTGMTVDTPTHLATHLYMIFLSFPGGSIQNSGVGKPADWTVVSGASEIAVGDDCTGFLEEVGDSLFAFTRNQKYQLNGKTVQTFDLQRYDRENGAIPGSVQRIGMGLYLDDRGFGSLLTTDRFGNYEANSFSRLIQPLVDELLRTTTVTCSTIYRRRNRYRCFFADGRFISIGVDGQEITGSLVCDYGKVVRCICSEEDTDGTERIFFGSDDGQIYEAEKGTSFDGAPIRAGLRLHNHHSDAPDRTKRYRRLRTEAQLDGPTTLIVEVNYGQNDPNLNPIEGQSENITAPSGGMSWDDGHEWELFDWDSEVDALKEADLEGEATSIGLSYSHESANETPHTLRAVNLQISGRRIDRRRTA